LRLVAAGNVTPWLVAGTLRQLVTQHGTLGHTLPRLREERIAFPPAATAIVCSDGLRSRWSFDRYPELLARHAETISAVLWRDFVRGRDDATAVVLREARTRQGTVPG
ncbi:MAG: hypothetical protein H0T79_23750, partial [Deltaproteobacteria bacterium]|nr:hypothetical protein [Deltaproteobacteria bacterium]